MTAGKDLWYECPECGREYILNTNTMNKFKRVHEQYCGWCSTDPGSVRELILRTPITIAEFGALKEAEQ